MKIQNENIKSSSELIADGGTAAQLPNDDKIWVTANTINKTLKQAIIDGNIGGGGTGAGAARFKNPSGTVPTTKTTINYSTTDYNAIGTYSAGEFTSTTTGYLIISASIACDGSFSAGNQAQIYIQKDSGGGYVDIAYDFEEKAGNFTGSGVSVIASTSINNGDKIRVQGLFAGSGLVWYNANTANLFQIWALPSAGSFCGIDYGHSTGSSIGTGIQTISFNVNNYDSHSAFSGTVFTVPAGQGGKYRVHTQLGYTATSTSSGDVYRTYITKNGTSDIAYKRYVIESSISQNTDIDLYKDVQLSAGDTIRIRTDNAVTRSLDADATRTWLSISRIG